MGISWREPDCPLRWGRRLVDGKGCREDPAHLIATFCDSPNRHLEGLHSIVGAVGKGTGAKVGHPAAPRPLEPTVPGVRPALRQIAGGGDPRIHVSVCSNAGHRRGYDSEAVEVEEDAARSRRRAVPIEARRRSRGESDENAVSLPPLDAQDRPAIGPVASFRVVSTRNNQNRWKPNTLSQRKASRGR
jgi:hypothetical protein